MLFSYHLRLQWLGGLAGAVVGTGLALASEGYLEVEPDPD
jgi:hypothetical protein